jgi:RNA polymerase sigma-70 factor (ECF subfamily)
MSSQQHLQFRTLMARMQAGSSDAAWRLVELYETHVRAVVRRRMTPSMRSLFDSDDFVQAVWASLIRIAPQLDGIDRPEKLVALLARMARNKVVDQYRRLQLAAKHNVRRQQPLDDSDVSRAAAIARAHSTPSQVAVARERWERLLKRQPVRNRKILEMRLAGATYVEIAQEVAIHERSVRRIVDRLLKAQTG